MAQKATICRTRAREFNGIERLLQEFDVLSGLVHSKVDSECIKSHRKVARSFQLAPPKLSSQ